MIDLPDYPVRSIGTRLRETLEDTRSSIAGAIIRAPAGSGKSTLVPFMLHDADWRRGKTIILTQPRRAAVRALYDRIVELSRGTCRIGYITRGDSRVPGSPDILIVTEGVLQRKLLEDPELVDCAAVILDEFHERSLLSDANHAMIRQSVEALRADLRLIIMSATIDDDLVGKLDLPLITAEGRMFPVSTAYAPCPKDRQLWKHAAMQAIHAVGSPDCSDSCLVFLPGEGEIERAAEYLRTVNDDSRLLILPLYGRLSTREQNRAIHPPETGMRKIVLATNVAETSLTIEGVTVVVDSGLQRSPRYDPAIGLTRMNTERISRASAQQRAGRAGRLGPGTVIRLWDEQEVLDSRRTPEILSEDLGSLLLALAFWGSIEAGQYLWPDTPDPRNWEDARQLLISLGALDDRDRITGRGRLMAGLPLHPRLSAMVIQASDIPAARDTAARLAALLENGDPLTREAAGQFGADIEVRLQAQSLSSGMVRRSILHRIDHDVRGIQAMFRQAAGKNNFNHASGPDSRPVNNGSPSPAAILSWAFPDRIARHLGEGQYQLAGGSTYAIHEGERRFQPQWILAAEIKRSLRGGRIFLAAAFPDDEIAREIRDGAMTRIELSADDSGKLLAREVRTYRSIEIGSRPVKFGELRDPQAAIIALVKARGVGILPWTNEDRNLQSRLAVLHLRLGADWPELSDESLTASAKRWLPAFISPRPSADCLQRIPVSEVLRSLLPWNLAASVDRLAPKYFTLPSGSRRQLEYRDGKVVLSARIQQLFGMENSPMVAGQPLEIELLSPARRPVQITGDLESFWSTTYAEVRKELRGRYPKHYWPEDPRTAEATDGTRPR